MTFIANVTQSSSASARDAGPFERLPDRLLGKVSQYLQTPDLLAASWTNRSLRDRVIKAVHLNRSEAFLHYLLLEMPGIYTLLGDKPVTMTENIHDTGPSTSLCSNEPSSEMELDYLKDCQEEEKYWKDIFNGYQAWKRFSQNLTFQNFRFVELSSSDPLSPTCLIINLIALRKLLQNYKRVFEYYDQGFDVETVIRELSHPKSPFLDKAFKNRYLIGLLLGYGEENSRYFAQTASTCGVSTEHWQAENLELQREKEAYYFQGPITPEHFPLPAFASKTSRKDDPRMNEYRRQREAIKQIYRNKNFLDTTLRILMPNSHL